MSKMFPPKIFYGVKYFMSSDGYYRVSQKSIVPDGVEKMLHREVWRRTNGPIPKGYVVHHTDHNKANNDIDNLECMSAGAHTLLHAKEKWGSYLYEDFLCAECGKTDKRAIGIKNVKMYCSKKCMFKARDRRRAPLRRRPIVVSEVACAHCGGVFDQKVVGGSTPQVYCSWRCKRRAGKLREAD